MDGVDGPDGVTSGDMGLLRSENDALKREIKALKLHATELERLADSDTLTPLYNRRAFLREVERILARVDRHGTKAAVMIADLDLLKAINDEQGHQAGDAALLHVAYVLKRNVRSSDIVARISGDEFALVLEEIGEHDAAAKARALAAAVAAEPSDAGPISISIGYAVVNPDDSVDSLIARADAAMYRAKDDQRSAR